MEKVFTDFPERPVKEETEVSVSVAGRELFCGPAVEAEAFIQQHAIFSAQKKERKNVSGARWVLTTDGAWNETGKSIYEYREYLTPHFLFSREDHDECGQYRVKARRLSYGDTDIVLTDEKCYIYVPGCAEGIIVGNAFEEFIEVEIPTALEELGFIEP